MARKTTANGAPQPVPEAQAPAEAQPSPARPTQTIPVDPHRIAAALAAPFDPAEVKFKPQAVTGNRALAIPYVDARVIQDRLDDVLGVMGWQDSYTGLAGGCVVCRLSIRLGDEWITKEDVGGPSEQPDEGDRTKSAYSDALKRAAVKFGIGRYLYRTRPQWVDYDPQKRQFVRPPSLLTAPGPERPRAGLSQPAPAEAQPIDAAEVSVVYQKILTTEQRLVEEGRCKAGDLQVYLIAQLAGVIKGPIEQWPVSTDRIVADAVKWFKKVHPARAGARHAHA